jgi:hypothetical protein
MSNLLFLSQASASDADTIMSDCESIGSLADFIEEDTAIPMPSRKRKSTDVASSYDLSEVENDVKPKCVPNDDKITNFSGVEMSPRFSNGNDVTQTNSQITNSHPNPGSQHILPGSQPIDIQNTTPQSGSQQS